MMASNERNSRDVSSRVYSENQAETYDKKRFETRQGRTIHDLEMRQLELAIDRLDVGAKVLEVGAGTARFSIELARRGFEVTALEPSGEMLSKAKQKADESGISGISFVNRLGDDTGFPGGTFDLVFSARVLNRLTSKEIANSIVKEKVRVTRPNGLIFLDIATKGFPLPRPGKPVLYSKKEIREIASSLGCEVIETRGMFILSSQFVAKLPSFLLPFWSWIERGLSKPLYGISSKGAIVLRKNAEV